MFTTEHARRLIVLADYLHHQVKRETFNMGSFWCGTAGCAMAHGALMPEFQKLGLRLLKGYHSGTVEYHGLTGFAAAERLFGLTGQEADHLFVPRPGHLTPKQVAYNLRRFAQRKLRELATCRGS